MSNKFVDIVLKTRDNEHEYYLVKRFLSICKKTE